MEADIRYKYIVEAKSKDIMQIKKYSQDIHKNIQHYKCLYF